MLSVENFFKNSEQYVKSGNDSNQLIIDNILIKLKSVTVSRAIMTLTRDLEVQVKSMTFIQLLRTHTYYLIILIRASVTLYGNDFRNL